MADNCNFNMILPEPDEMVQDQEASMDVSVYEHDINTEVHVEIVPRSIEVETASLSTELYLQSRKGRNVQKCENSVEKIFNQTMETCNSINGTSFKPLMEAAADELPEQLCKYVMSVKRSNGEDYNASSLGCHVVHLQRMLRLREFEPVDIKNDLRFVRVHLVLKARRTELASRGKVPGINASQEVPADVLLKLYEMDLMSRNNPRALALLIWFQMVSILGFRSKEECHNCQNEDLVYGPNNQFGVPQYITVSERVSKCRRGQTHQQRELQPRMYADDDFPDVCPVRNFLVFQSKKTPLQKLPNVQLLLGVKQSAQQDPMKEQMWYISCPMGINMIGTLLKTAIAATGADPKTMKISSTSARKSLAQAAVDSGCNEYATSKVMGHINPNSKGSYMKMKSNLQKATTVAINRTLMGKKKNDFATVMKQCNESNTTSTPTPPAPIANPGNLPMAPFNMGPPLPMYGPRPVMFESSPSVPTYGNSYFGCPNVPPMSPMMIPQPGWYAQNGWFAQNPWYPPNPGYSYPSTSNFPVGGPSHQQKEASEQPPPSSFSNEPSPLADVTNKKKGKSKSGKGVKNAAGSLKIRLKKGANNNYRVIDENNE